MEIQEILNVLALVSIIIGAILGIMGSATSTKDKLGNLTRWGKIAIAGIIFSNSIYFTKIYLDQQWQKKKTQQSIEESRKKLELETNRFESTMQKWSENFDKQEEIISKTEASFKTSKEIQKKTESINIDVQNNLEKQDTIISSTVSLNQKQNEIYESQIGILDSLRLVNKQINRTLNPFKPFAIEFIVRINADSLKSSNKLFYDSNAHEKLVMAIENDLHENSTIEKTLDSNGHYFYKLPNDFISSGHFDFLKNVMVNINFVISNKTGEFETDVVFSSEFECYNDTIMKLGRWDVYYFPDTKDYEILFYTGRMRIIEDRQIIKSIIDTAGKELILTITGLPASTELKKFTLLFPPLYSNRVNVMVKGKHLQLNHKFRGSILN